MFKKLLSNLPFNPSLIAQVSFYARRMRQEAVVRRFGFIMLALTMLVQMFAVASPPQASAQSSNNDIIKGGITSRENAVDWCNSNEEIRGIYGYFGVSCQAIADSTVEDSVNTHDYHDQMYSLGRYPYDKEGETAVVIGSGTYYMRYVWSWGDYNFKALKGTRSDGTPFLIMFDCGNIIIIGPPTAPPPPQPTTPPPPAVSQACLNGTASFTVSWPEDGKGSAGYYVNLFRDNNGSPNQTLGQFYNRQMPPGQNSTTGPDGFRVYDGSANPGAPLGSLVSGAQYHINIHYIAPNQHSPFISFVALNCTTPPPPNKCPIDTTLLQSDSRCTPCPYNNTIIASNTACKPPKCPYDGTITADNPKCTACPYDSSITKTNAHCERCPYTGLTNISKLDVKCIEPCPYNNTIAKTNAACERCPYAGLGSLSKLDAKCIEPCPYTSNISKNSPDCKPCNKSTTQTDTTACIVLSKKASNTTQNIANADGTTASGGDVIVYTLSAKNTGKVTVKDFAVEENIGDLLDYADVVDLHRGSWDKKTNVVTWPKADISADGTLLQNLTVKVKNPVPQTPVSTSNPGTGDLTMTNVYGNAINIKLPPTIVKTTEQLTRTLPNTGPGTSLIIGFTMATVVAYFFARTKLFVAELDLVRVEFAAAGGQ